MIEKAKITQELTNCCLILHVPAVRFLFTVYFNKHRYLSCDEANAFPGIGDKSQQNSL